MIMWASKQHEASHDVPYISYTCRGRLGAVANHVNKTDTLVPPVGVYTLSPTNNAYKLSFLPNNILKRSNLPLVVSAPNPPNFGHCHT